MSSAYERDRVMAVALDVELNTARGQGAAASAPLPFAALEQRGGQHAGASCPAPEAHIVDIVVHAMSLARDSWELQEHACSILATLAIELVRGGLSAARGGHADTDAASRAAVQEEARSLRSRAFRGGAVDALVTAMRLHGHVTRVLHVAMLALYALVDTADASEGKHQAAEAGVFELISMHLQARPPPLCIWNMGRILLMALIRHEPALRRRAKRALPRWQCEYSLAALSL